MDTKDLLDYRFNVMMKDAHGNKKVPLVLLGGLGVSHIRESQESPGIPRTK